MVNSELVEHCRLQIVNIARVFNGVTTELISRTPLTPPPAIQTLIVALKK